jgi:NarL family two-component system sensor histidine kinase LiaS
MNIVFKLVVLLSLLPVISGIQCASFDSGTSVSEDNQKEYKEHHQPDFAKDTVLINQYLALAKSYLYTDAEKTMENAKLVLKLSQKQDWAKGKIKAYNILSTFYLMDGSYDVLRELSSETNILAQRLNLPIYSAHARRFIAESYSEFRQWDSAQVNYAHALKTFADMNDDSARALCLENIGNMYREREMVKPAIDHYDQAYRLFVKLGLRSGQASVLHNRGYMFVRSDDHQIARRYYTKALELYRADKNFYGELSLLNDLGNSYYWDKQYDKAIEMCTIALAYAKQYHSTQQTNWAHQTLGRAYKAKNMLKESIYHSENAYYYRRQIHDDYIRRQYTMYELMYKNQQMNSAIQKRIIDEQKQVQRFLIGFISLIIAFAAFLWYNNKKLRRKNTEIQEAMIQGQTIERKRVAADLHDNLGGTLASLNWYLFGIDKKALSAEELKTYESVHQMVGAAYREVRSLSHNLMPAELEEYGLITALERLTGKLNENKKIAFTFNHNGIVRRYGSKIEFELYSVVLELTNNIIKHSGASRADITIEESAKNIRLLVKDNGTGITDNSKQGMGLNNVRSRVESLSGKIQIAHDQSNGTNIEIEIPNV